MKGLIVFPNFPKAVPSAAWLAHNKNIGTTGLYLPLSCFLALFAIFLRFLGCMVH